MGQGEYRGLLKYGQGIADLRKARGKRHPWTFLLGVILAALVNGQETPWVRVGQAACGGAVSGAEECAHGAGPLPDGRQGEPSGVAGGAPDLVCRASGLREKRRARASVP